MWTRHPRKLYLLYRIHLIYFLYLEALTTLFLSRSSLLSFFLPSFWNVHVFHPALISPTNSKNSDTVSPPLILRTLHWSFTKFKKERKRAELNANNFRSTSTLTPWVRACNVAFFLLSRLRALPHLIIFVSLSEFPSNPLYYSRIHLPVTFNFFPKRDYILKLKNLF